MELSVILAEPTWKDIIRINRRDGTFNADILVRDVLDACREVSDPGGCIIWTTSSIVYECRCFGDDYRGYGFKSNLEGQMYYNFSPDVNPVTRCAGHGDRLTGRIRGILANEVLSLRYLQVKGLQFGGDEISHAAFSQQAGIAAAVSALLTAHYLKKGQCAWHS